MRTILTLSFIIFAGLSFAEDNAALLGTPELTGDLKEVRLVVAFDKGEGVGKATKNKDVILLDIMPATLPVAGIEIPFSDMLVSKIKTEQYDKTVVRITITCIKECEFSINNEKVRISLVLTPTSGVQVNEAAKKLEENSVSMEKVAQATTEAVAKSETTSEAGEFGVGSLAGKKGNLEQIVDHINTLNADLPSLLNILCTEAGFNLITSKSVSGTIPSIQLKNVSLKKVLDLLLKQNGYTYKVEGNIIRVATNAEMKQETEESLVETRTFGISFAKAGVIMTTIMPMLSSAGKIQTDTRTNSLLVTDISMKLDEIAEILKKLDTQTKQVQIEAKLVDIGYNNTDTLGIRWDLGGGPTGGLPGAIGSDIFPPAGNVVFRGSVKAPASSSAGSFQFGIAGSTSFWLSLEALIEKREANLLANPRITTLDNVSATMNITQSNPYRSGYDAVTQISSYASIDSGIELTVLPQINRNGFITLQVTSKVSSAGTGTPPPVETRSASTSVLVRDQETLVIGGLIREQEDTLVTKIPMLGDLPLIGPLLFQSREVKKTKRDLVIFITPKIIE